MGRNFARITIPEFKEKIEEALKKHDDFEDHGEYSSGSVLEDQSCLLADLTKTVYADLSKVKFSTENVCCEGRDDEPTGFQTTKYGLTCLGVRAGGDWEIPIFFIIYWDGKELRAYIPSNGNPYNKTTKKAFGNDHEADWKAYKKQYPQYIELAKCTGLEDDELDSDSFPLDEINPEPDWRAVAVDIKNRLTEKKA